MAGIGFRLQRLMSGESYTELLTAYLYSAIITAGPMLVVIATVAALKVTLRQVVSLEEGDLLLGLLVYVYCFSLIGTGPLQYVVTRFLADQYYRKRLTTLGPTYAAVITLTFLVLGSVVALYLAWQPWPLLLRLVTGMLFLLVSGIWIAMLFLSAARSYRWIVAAFVLGGAGGLAAAAWLGPRAGFTGFLIGYTAGQAITFFLLSGRIIREFGFTGRLDFEFLSYFGRYRLLGVIGLCYTLGIWIDKLLFWGSSVGDRLGAGLRVCFQYDTPMFLAFLTIVPSMAYFLVQMETHFARQYWRYFDTIRRRAPLDAIERDAAALQRTVYRQLQQFVLFQGIVSAAIILFLINVTESFGLNPGQFGVFRIAILGAFLQMGYLIILTYFFYFDWQREACWLTVIFLATNALGTWITLHVGLPAYGYGYTGAALLSCAIAAWWLTHKLDHLVYWTFATQPILRPPARFEAERAEPPLPEAEST